MLINLRNALMAGKKWKNPYITDGLMLQWDGVWNAGGGIHDATRVTSVKDIVGNNDLPIGQAYAVVSDDAVIFDGSQSARCEVDFNVSNWLNNAGTAEIVASYDSPEDKANFDIGTTTVNNRGLRPTTYSNAGTYNQLIVTLEYRLNTYRVVRVGGRYTQGTRTALAFVTNPSGGTVDAYTGGRYLSTVQGGTQTSFNNYISIGVGGTQSPPLARKMHLCSFRLYSRALTAAEIAANYAIDKARFGLP